jgi:hypothetical protein
MDRKSDTNAAQMRNKPEPVDTCMPTGTGCAATMTVLTDEVVLIMTVQMLAPMRRKRLPIIARVVDAKNV